MSQTSESTEQEVEARILAAAERLRAQSPDNLTMGELAREAGVSRATLYRYFPGQEALVARLSAQAPDGGPPVLRTPMRDRILRAAREVVGEVGFLACTVEQIAERTGASAVSVFRAFGDKEGLLRAVFAESTPRRDIPALLKDVEAPVADTLTRFVTALLQFFKSEPLFMRTLLFSQGAERTYLQTLRSQQEGMGLRLIRYLEAQIKRGRLRARPVEDLARALQGMVIGSAMVSFSLDAPTKAPSRGGEPADVEQRARALVEIFMNGAAAPRSGGTRR